MRPIAEQLVEYYGFALVLIGLALSGSPLTLNFPSITLTYGRTLDDGRRTYLAFTLKFNLEGNPLFAGAGVHVGKSNSPPNAN